MRSLLANFLVALAVFVAVLWIGLARNQAQIAGLAARNGVATPATSAAPDTPAAVPAPTVQTVP